MLSEYRVHPSLFSWFLVILLLSVLLLPASLRASDTDGADRAQYLAELVERAQARGLSARHEWRGLLHYQRSLTGGSTSMQDNPGFFLSLRGKTDPEAELIATLRAFFSEALVGKSQQPAQCAFVARYHWLKHTLQFDDARLPPMACPRFEQWFAEFNADGVSMIFPAGFMNNPSSMFGHTFLRIDQRGQTAHTRILAYTINYAAELPPDAGLEYPIKGIFGGYKGLFTTIPYYLKVQEYRDFEHRDVWEYRLNFGPDEIRRLLMHAWELGNADFDYYFFGENCSYHILSLLDVARPELHLTDQFPLYTIPSDSLRALLAVDGLVGEVTYRPSRVSLVRRRREAMSGTERLWLTRLIQEPARMQEPEFFDLTSERKAFVLDTASDYLLVRSEAADERDSVWRARNRAILGARSALKVPSPPFEIVPITQRPDSGHGTSRVTVGTGWRNDALYEEASFRLAYHDLLDREAGYTPDAQIEAMAISLRHYHRHDQTRIERFTLLNMTSLSPMDRLFHAPSWRLNLGMNTIRHGTCELCSNGVASAGIGGAFDTTLLRREVWFAFADLEGNYSRAYEERHRLGGGGTVGVLMDVTERWKLLASTSYLRYALGEHSEDWRWSVGQRFTISQHWALRMEYAHRDRDNDVLLTIHGYF